MTQQLPMLSGRTLRENYADVKLYHICLNQAEKDLQNQMMYLWKGARHVGTLKYVDNKGKSINHGKI